MKNTNSFSFSDIQNAVLIGISVVYVVSMWNAVPMSNLAKALLVVIFWGAVYLAAYLFSHRLAAFKVVKTEKTAIAITATVFLLFPLLGNLVYSANANNYLASYPADDYISVKLRCDIERVGGSGSIGDQWSYYHYYNQTEFKDGDTLTVKATLPFTITSKFVEHDAIPDVGVTKSRLLRFFENGNYDRTLTMSQLIHVEERGGRRYAGSTANFRATYTLERVVPSTMNYWDMLLYGSGNSNFNFGYVVIAGHVLCLLCVGFIVFMGENASEKLQRIIEHQKCQAEETAFLKRLEGKSVRELAGVPPNIEFVGMLPKDDNSGCYGSFTVYCTSNGSCYHDQKGCCSATTPVHYFMAKTHLRPCPKCCHIHREIPTWYTEYVDILYRVKKLALQLTESEEDHIN